MSENESSKQSGGAEDNKPKGKDQDGSQEATKKLDPSSPGETGTTPGSNGK